MIFGKSESYYIGDIVDYKNSISNYINTICHTDKNNIHQLFRRKPIKDEKDITLNVYSSTRHSFIVQGYIKI